MKKLNFVSAFLSILICFSGLYAQTPKKICYAYKVNPHPPVIDGLLNDVVWSKAQWAGDFVQRTPHEGAAPSQQTAFKIVYDESNLYIFIKAYDTEPDKIVQRMARRDWATGDFVEINIDCNLDKRTAFSFSITSAGVQCDEYISNGNSWDINWNAIWHTKTSIDDEGWNAEVKIPFSQLRFPDKEEHVWGVQVKRKLFRKEERSNWQFIPQNSTGWVHLFGEIHGIHGIKMPKRIELLPYTVAKGHTYQRDAGNPFATGRDGKSNLGLDGKIGLSGNLTMDFTVNPDFGQVEADPSEVNLTAYESYFHEKRPFFMEGNDIMDFHTGTGDIFYSRRIGRNPHYYPDTEDGEYVNMPDNTTILGAMKITGKLQNGISLGILNAFTSKESAEIEFNGSRRSEVVEPYTNYSLVRMQKEYNGGNTVVGAIATGTMRDLSDSHLKFLNKAAYTGGMDFQTNWKERKYYFNMKTVFSNIRGNKEAILRAQESSARYFQRPDADYVSVDPERTSLTGHGGRFTFGKQGGNWNYDFSTRWASPGLELNDLGYLSRADRIRQNSWLGYRTNKPGTVFREFSLNLNQRSEWNFGRQNLSNSGNINFWGRFNNFWSINGGVNREGNALSTSMLRGGPAMKYSGGWAYWYGIGTDQRKALNLHFGGEGYKSSDGISNSLNFYSWGTWQASTRLNFQFNPNYNIRKSDLQYISKIETESGDRYVFGKIDQKTVSLTMRFNYNITPDLTIQYYGQPFVSAGKYASFKYITDPGAEKYENRFHNYSGKELNYDAEESAYMISEGESGLLNYSFGKPDYSFVQFRSNLVIRWQYIPGSTMYLVWTQGRTGFDGTGDFSYRDNIRSLYDVYPNNVFLIKIAHWFSL